MPRKLIRLPEVRARCGNKSPAQIWRDVRKGTFPAPVEIGPNSKAWFADEIDKWQENLPRVNYAPAIETVDARANTEDVEREQAVDQANNNPGFVPDSQNDATDARKAASG